VLGVFGGLGGHMSAFCAKNNVTYLFDK